MQEFVSISDTTCLETVHFVGWTQQGSHSTSTNGTAITGLYEDLKAFYE